MNCSIRILTFNVTMTRRIFILQVCVKLLGWFDDSTRTLDWKQGFSQAFNFFGGVRSNEANNEDSAALIHNPVYLNFMSCGF